LISFNSAERSYPVDIAFLIGSSPSTTQDQWRATLDFVKSIADQFPVLQRGARIGVISFDTTPRVGFAFNALTGPQLNNYEVRRLIDRVPYSNGPTRIDKALKLANTYLFTPQGGARKDSLKVPTCFLDLLYYYCCKLTSRYQSAKAMILSFQMSVID